MTHEEASVQERKAIQEAIGKNDETMNAAKSLIDNFNHVKWHTLHEFWTELGEAFEKRHCSFTKTDNLEDAISAITDSFQNTQKEQCGLTISLSSYFEFEIIHDSGHALWWGISKPRDPRTHPFYELLEQLTKEKELEATDHCWWNWITLENGEKLSLKNFSEDATFNLINPAKRTATIAQIVQQILDFLQKHLPAIPIPSLLEEE